MIIIDANKSICLQNYLQIYSTTRWQRGGGESWPTATTATSITTSGDSYSRIRKRKQSQAKRREEKEQQKLNSHNEQNRTEPPQSLIAEVAWPSHPSIRNQVSVVQLKPPN